NPLILHRDNSDEGQHERGSVDSRLTEHLPKRSGFRIESFREHCLSNLLADPSPVACVSTESEFLGKVNDAVECQPAMCLRVNVMARFSPFLPNAAVRTPPIAHSQGGD